MTAPVRRTSCEKAAAKHAAGLLCALTVCVFVNGCGQAPQAVFALRESTRDLIPETRAAVEKTLLESFGTPNTIVVWDKLPVNFGGTKPAADADPATVTASDYGSTLKFGRSVYMKNCHHCHGVAGDGKGPTAKYLNPRPRDFRLGILKFTSTHSTERASRADIRQTLLDGIPGTYMPSFLLIGEKELDAVIEYVRWLAMRGELEKRLGDDLTDYSLTGIETDLKQDEEQYKSAIADGEKPEPIKSREDRLAKAAKDFVMAVEDEEYKDAVDGAADFIASVWSRAEEPSSVVIPSEARVADSAESRERGRLLYLSDRTKCYTCHGPTGRGNGTSADEFAKKPGSSESYAVRGLHDTWGNPLPPRDLTKGQYRGGRRPIDLYRRLYAGIKGTPMPAFGGTVLKDAEIWDVVNYVMSLQYTANSASPAPPAATASIQR